MTSPLSFVGVADTKYGNGAVGFDDKGFYGIDKAGEKCSVDELKGMPLEDALSQHFATDAHISTYAYMVGGQIQSVFPRMNKECVPKLREVGADVVTTVLIFDYDNPGHALWTPTFRDVFQSALLKAIDGGLAIAKQFHALYYTTHGARFVYKLTRPISIEDHEGIALGMMRDFRKYGILFDEKCANFNRYFRAPRVVRVHDDDRPDEKTWESDYFDIFIDESAEPLDPSTIKPGKKASKVLSVNVGHEEMPDPEDAEALLTEVSPSGRKVATFWYKQARKLLQGRECYDCLFNGAPLAEKGDRNDAIQAHVGQAVAMLHGLKGSSPRLIFGLFSKALQALNEGDPDDAENFIRTGWAAVQKYWASESAKAEEEAERQRQDDKVTQSFFDFVLSRVQEWCDHPAMKDPKTAGHYLSEILIAATSVGYYVMTPEGRYDSIPVSQTQLRARIRELRMHTLIPLEYEGRNGKMETKPSKIIDDHATRISRVRAQFGKPGGTIQNIGSAHATLIYGLYDKNPRITPEYNEAVHRWLTLLGRDNPELFFSWLEHVLDFSRPTCALSLAGPPGCGKKLLVQALGECLNTECVSRGEVFGRWNANLLRSPIISIDEGWPRNLSMDEIADKFRRLVNGDSTMVEQKYLDHIEARVCWRVVLTANNMELVEGISGKKDLSPHDREAIGTKIIHFNIPDEAVLYLKDNGGRDFTDGWIAGDSGEPSKYIIARHILWLFENRRPVPQGQRFLVEGTNQPIIHRILTARSGKAPAVIEALVSMIEKSDSNPPGFHIHEGKRVFVTPSGVITHLRQFFPDTRIGSQRSITDALIGVCTSATSPVQEFGGLEARWREVDLNLLLREAQDHGHQCTHLKGFVTKANEQDEMARQLAMMTQEKLS